MKIKLIILCFCLVAGTCFAFAQSSSSKQKQTEEELIKMVQQSELEVRQQQGKIDAITWDYFRGKADFDTYLGIFEEKSLEAKMRAIEEIKEMVEKQAKTAKGYEIEMDSILEDLKYKIKEETGISPKIDDSNIKTPPDNKDKFVNWLNKKYTEQGRTLYQDQKTKIQRMYTDAESQYRKKEEQWNKAKIEELQLRDQLHTLLAKCPECKSKYEQKFNK